MLCQVRADAVGGAVGYPQVGVFEQFKKMFLINT
jgi:hypothetical protein